MKRTIYIRKIALGVIVLSLLSMGCKKYLDKKPDQALIIPTSLEDASLLLEVYDVMNNQYPYLGLMSDDNSYFLDATFDGRPIDQKNLYTWDKSSIADEDWTRLYRVIAQANVALETVNEIQPGAGNQNEYNRIKGSALFYKAYALYHVAQYYSAPYDKSVSSTTLGIPLRPTSDVSEKSERATLEQTYQQIVSDFKQASKLLPLTNPPLSRPNKTAAYAALARTYLTMNEYALAKEYADSCLAQYNTLLNFNNPTQVNLAAQIPFQRFNAEVLFQAVDLGISIAVPTTGRIDTLLYRSYITDDLRRTAYFRSNGVGTFGFKGNYDGSRFGSNFSGLATDEIYLIRAECNARLQNVNAAMDDLNTLLVTRWKTNTFVPFTAADPAEALQKILTERRKELVGRGLRWFDLRRLNKESNQITLTRLINGQTFILPPNDPRYTFLIPKQVIDLTGMQQNTR